MESSIGKTGPVSYVVTSTNGTNCRRHIDSIKQRYSEISQQGCTQGADFFGLNIQCTHVRTQQTPEPIINLLPDSPTIEPS